MTTNTDIVNRALQLIGTRTTVTDAELANSSTNEAIQANLILANIRRRLLRMAPWDCALRTANLVYISSVPGTPENTSPAQTLWAPGIPTPPWAYEYQYPVDCLRACWIIPATQTGFAGGIPITTAVTGGAPSFWLGPPVKFKVQSDQFVPVVGISAIISPVTAFPYAVGDTITLSIGPSTEAPIGAPAQILVTSINGNGTIASASIISQVPYANPAVGGSYFSRNDNWSFQASTSGTGEGAAFVLTWGTTPVRQRVVLTNQEFATLVYCCDVIDPNVMDDIFQDAFVKVLAATMNNALQGDVKITNSLIQQANVSIMEARNVDSNEGLTINDVTPDWIRVRGVEFADQYSGPNLGYDWGGLWAAFG